MENNWKNVYLGARRRRGGIEPVTARFRVQRRVHWAKAVPLESFMQQKLAHPGHRSVEFAAIGRLSSEKVVPE